MPRQWAQTSVRPTRQILSSGERYRRRTEDYRKKPVQGYRRNGWLLRIRSIDADGPSIATGMWRRCSTATRSNWLDRGGRRAAYEYLSRFTRKRWWISSVSWDAEHAVNEIAGKRVEVLGKKTFAFRWNKRFLAFSLRRGSSCLIAGCNPAQTAIRPVLFGPAHGFLILFSQKSVLGCPDICLPSSGGWYSYLIGASGIFSGGGGASSH